MVVQNSRWDREARLWPIIGSPLPKFPSVHEQQHAIWCQALLHVELEANRGVDTAGNTERKRGDKEPDACLAVEQVVGKRTRCPVGDGERREMLPLALAVEGALVEDATNSVGEATINKGISP